MRSVSLALALLASGAMPGTSRPAAHPAPPAHAAASPRFEISFPASAHAQPITGRVFLAISRDSAPPPIANAGSFTNSTPLFGLDVSALAPGQDAVIDASTPGYPTVSLTDIPVGDYWVQAVMNVYTEFHRADGHTIWAHMDQWEGQNFTASPGNLVSAPQRVHFDPAAATDVKLELTHVIPPIKMPPDTKWVKHIKIQSALLTRFWGHPFYLGATVLLPAGYDTHPDVHYPVVFQQGHFGLGAPLGFNPDSFPLPPQYKALFDSYNLEPGWVFARHWKGPNMPRMIAVTFQHPTPVLRRLVRRELGQQRPVRRRDHDRADSVPGVALPDDPGAVRAGAHRRLHGRLGIDRAPDLSPQVLRRHLDPVPRSGGLPSLRYLRRVRRHERVRGRRARHRPVQSDQRVVPS